MNKIGKLLATDDSTLLKRKLLRQLLDEEGIDAQKGQSIPATPRSGDELLPLSFAQQRLWFLDKLEPNSSHYNIPFMLRLTGALDIDLLARCFNTILMRHESLRTTFHEIDGRSVQLISPEARVNLEVEDLRALPPDEQEDERQARVKAIADEEAARPFDLSQGPLWRVRLIRRESEEHILLLTMHHIVSDGWSMGVFMRETAAFYEAFSKGRPYPLDDLPIQYADYAMWQRERLSGDILDRELAYWRIQLSGAPLTLDLPTDYPRPAVQKHRGACRSVLIAKSVGEELVAISRRENATLFMTLLAAFNALLRRYTGEHDITIGSPIAGRISPEIEGLIGFFVNTLVMRVNLPGDATFLELVRRVRETAISAYAHQELPFEKLLEELSPERDLSRHPLFQVAIVMQNTPFPALELPGVRIEPMEIENHTAKFDLTLSIEESEEGLKAYLEYDTGLFADSTIVRLLTHFEILLRGIIENPQRRISELPLLSEGERLLLLAPKNISRLRRQPDAVACLHRLFEAQAARTPDSVALVFEGETVTYDALNRRANQTAYCLRRFGVGPETPVGLMMERSLEGWGDMIVGLIGILKAGGAYVPLDPTYPHERLTFMLEDTRAPVLLTRRKFAGRFSGAGVQEIYMDADWESIAAESGEDSLVPLPPENPAYVIYTSGTTGKPKGVVVSHSNVARLFTTTQPWFHFESRQGRQDVWTLFHSYAFDFSVWEIWGALLYGGKLVVVPYWVSRTPESFYDLLVEEQVTVLNQTPSAFRQLIRIDSATAQSRITALRYVIFGGEALDLKSLSPWFDRHRDTQPQLVNMYGITETCVHVTCRPLTADDLAGGSMIGVSIPDLSVYALDQHLQPVPFGVSGEIYVGGRGLSRGYLNRPELTAERFLPNPFGFEPGERLYRTGDRARFLPDGDIEYLGRLDYQVKIRGFRIELQEIEAVIKSHPGTRECVIIMREDAPGDKRLVAYVVADHNAPPTRDELRLFVRERLPDYMAPSLFVFQDELPLTAQGKIDRRALLQHDYRRDSLTADTFVAPRNEVETILAEVWAEALGVERVGIDDNYFALGGDSIRSIRVRAMATERGLKFSLQQLFQYQTIRELSLVCETIKSETSTTLPFSLISAEDKAKLAADTTGIEDAYPLSHTQAGLVFHSEYSRDYIVYLSSFHLRAPFDAEKLQEALQYVGDRHAIMRTSYSLTDFNEPLQLVHRKTPIPLTVEDLRHLPSEEMEAWLSSWIETEIRNRFDWAEPPLFRFRVHLRKYNEFQFTMTEPTIDGWSVASLVTELFERYFAILENGSLSPEPPLRSSYADFIRLERNALADIECQDFWEEKLRDDAGSRLPRLRGGSPTMREGVANQALPHGQATATSHTDIPLVERIDVTLQPAVSDRLWELAREFEVPLKSLLLAAHLKVVSFWSGKSDIFTGLFSNGRPEEADGERVLGVFLNILPFHFRLGRGNWEDLARAVFDAEREVLPFRRYPIQELQRIYQAENLFDTSFNYTHFHVYRRLHSIEELAVLSHFGTEQTYYALTAQFNVAETTSEVFLGLDYREQELSRDQVEAIAETYLTVLDAIVQDPCARHESLCLLPERERRQILYEWNAMDVEYPAAGSRREKCVHELFEEQAEMRPEAVALVCEDQSLSYGELNAQANRLARRLRGLGVGPDARVAICAERSVEMVMALLATLKAGGAYAPFDPAYPPERLAYMLKDCAPMVLLTQGGAGAALTDHTLGALAVDLEADAPLWATQSAQNPSRAGVGLNEKNLAYIIYTSGSTGLPKGTMIEHRSLVNLIDWHCEAFQLTAADRSSCVAGVGFDAATWEIWPTLCAGATLLLASGATVRDPELLLAWWQAQPLDVSFLPTPIAEFAFARGIGNRSIRTLLVGGDRLQRLAGPSMTLSLINNYGPTEAAVVATSGGLEPSDTCLHIGRPISNTQIYILDASREPSPVGVVGEIYIGGRGVARGYLDRPELTAERFLPDPFGRDPAARIYKTGDLGHWLPDGNIQFLGRSDFQVKIRGFRIELGEIEAALASHPEVQEAVALAREDGAGGKRLVVYYTGAEIGAEALRKHLLSTLPEYMAPAAYVRLEVLPLTPNGKLDRKGLPAPEADAYSRRGYEAPQGETEALLAAIWAELLNLERVGRHDNFFELGGHSLLATRLVSRIRDAFHIEVSVRDLFENPTVEALGRRIERSLREGRGIDPVQFVAEARPELIPLSFAQQRLWFLDQLEPGSSFYNIPLALRLSGPLNVQGLEQSINEIIRRHETLRTSFHAFKQSGRLGLPGQHLGAPTQFIYDAAPMTIPIIDISHLPAEEREAEAERQAHEEARRPFDLSAGPLMRVILLRLNQNSHALLITMHHIISDGWSMGILLSEMASLYRAFSAGEPSPLPELAIQHADFAIWQRRWLSGEQIDRQLDYWKRQLAGAPSAVDLPTDRPYPPVRTFRGAKYHFLLSEWLLQEIKAVNRSHGVTLFMTLLAAFKILLYRYTGQSDIVIGSPIAGRNLREIENLIGFFVNTLVLRSDLGGAPRFSDLLGRVRETALGAYAHQDLPFEKLVEELQPERNLSRTPLFQVMFALENMALRGMELAGVQIDLMGIDSGGAKFDLTLLTSESQDGIDCVFEYNTDIFEEGAMARCAGHFRTLLEAVVKDPQQRISDIRLLTESERDQLLIEWNDTYVRLQPSLEGKCIHVLFEEQAALTPDAIAAVVSGSEQLTYGSLNKRAGELARYLRDLGITTDAPIGLCTGNSLEMLVGIMGILKAGGSYLPLDPSYPHERLAFMLRDAGTTTSLTTGHLAERFADCDLHIVCLDTLATELPWPSDSVANPQNPAYVIYTSGSTGTPKGVVVTHGNLAHSTLARVSYYRGAVGRFLLLSSVAFDSSVAGIFWTLTTGGALVLPPEGSTADAEMQAALIASHGITHLLALPALYRLILENARTNQLSSLQTAIVAGEACTEEVVNRHRAAVPQSLLFNEYGPSEATVWSSVYDCSSGYHLPRVPIGRPIANTQIYILDANLQPALVGVSGEIYIGGNGVTNGYLNRPDLTAERFIPKSVSQAPGARLYKTGDIGHYLADGNIEFIGRADQQIKLRGFRIELEEIEAVFKLHGAVREAVVSVREEVPGLKRLVGYVVCDEATNLQAVDLIAYLKERLPNYMVPSVCMLLKALPLTPNGKLDRDALPPPEQPRSEMEERFVAPRTRVETVVASIWAKILGVERISVNDNFFELGGHSLLAVQMVYQSAESLRVDLPMRTLFEAPTVADFAGKIERLLEIGTTQSEKDFSLSALIHTTERLKPVPLSFAQERLWFLNQLEPGNPFYNISAALRLRGRLRDELLKETLERLIARHESLRASFRVIDDRPRQIIDQHSEVPWSFVDLSGRPEAEAIVGPLASKEARHAFALDHPPLLRVVLYRIGDDDHVLLMNMHHIISDTQSVAILTREIGAIYQVLTEGGLPELPGLRLQYADYAVWQRKWLEGENLERELDYWRAKLMGVPTSLELPADRPRPAAQSHRGANYRWRLDAELSDLVKRLGRGEDATLFMTLLAAWQLLLARYSGQDDLLVGTPIANRTRAELEGVIGFFTNTLTLRATLAGAPTFREFLSETRRTTLEAYAHQDLPFEKLVEELRPERDLSRAPLFQVMFLLRDTPPSEPQMADLEIEELDLPMETAKFDLTLATAETSAGIEANIEYCVDIFDRETIERMAGHYTRLLENVAADPDERVWDVEFLSEIETIQIVEEWNHIDWANGAGRRSDVRFAHDAFERVAAESPDTVAVTYRSEHLSYEELKTQSDLLANLLAKYPGLRRVEAEPRIGLCLNRGISHVIAILGILKAGAAYVPLDPDYPAERLRFMATDAGVDLMVTEPGLESKFSDLHIPVSVLPTERLGTGNEEWGIGNWEKTPTPHSPLPTPHSTENLVYVIYTSGSTGRPKGVAMTHGAIANLIEWLGNLLRARARTAQFSSIGFDVCFEEVFCALSSGGTIVIVPPEERRDVSRLAELLRAEGVERVILPAAIVDLLIAEAARFVDEGRWVVKELISTAEQMHLKSEAWEWLSDKGCRIWNHYGPTETHVATAYELNDKDSDRAHHPPIGRPITGCRAYVLGPGFRPAPIGVLGEIYLGGTGVGRGYPNSPEQTAERFIPDPFGGEAGARLYHTGDLGRYLRDGAIEYLGRTDHQVKIRGVRVELGEIEAVLREHESVREVAASVFEDISGVKRLTAYIVLQSGMGLDTSALRRFLKERLPDYMIPPDFMTLDALPLNTNGKLDRRRLPGAKTVTAMSVAPRTTIEQITANVLAEALGLHKIGIHDNFFELGGHSLLATQVVSRLRSVLGVELVVRALFEAPTVAGLAAEVEVALGTRQASPIPPLQPCDGGRGSSSLAAIQPNGSRPPFFCVHPADGNVFCYVALSRMLGSDQPFYGLQAPGLDDDEEQYTEIEAAASGYITALRSVQPKGPYRLGGWSLGGVIAFEMARQLLECGEQVSRLILIDSFLPSRGEAIIQETDQSLLVGFALNLGLSIDQLAPVREELRLLGPDEQLNRILEMARVSELAPPDINVSTISKLRYVYDANVRAVNRYAPQTVPVQVTLLKASEPLSTDTESQILEWERWATLGVKIYEAPGYHFDMLREPNLKFLARILNNCLADRESLTTGQ